MRFMNLSHTYTYKQYITNLIKGAVSDFWESLLNTVIFEINQNKHSPPFIAPAQKYTNTQCKSECLFIIAEAKQNKSSKK